MSLDQNRLLVGELKGRGDIRSKNIFKAFLAIDRLDFVPPEYSDDAYLDVPIPLGHEVTTSQPSTIAFMLEKLKPRRDQKILEIGTGSGYVTALLARIVGSGGRVFSIELIGDLKKYAKMNLRKYDFSNVTLFVSDGKLGLPEKSPFDRIISSAEARVVPESWKEQLAVGGIIITPYDSQILKLTKKSNDKFTSQKFPAFAFVELK